MNCVKLKREITIPQAVRPVKSHDSREVKVSIIFTHLGEINTLKEIFTCEAILFVSWHESIAITTKNFINNSKCCQDPKNFWNPQLYIDSNIFISNFIQFIVF